MTSIAAITSARPARVVQSLQKRMSSLAAGCLAASLGSSFGSICWTSPASADDRGSVILLPESTPLLRHVVIETTARAVSLERNEPVLSEFGWRLDWRPICVSPCSVDVPATGLYRLSGPGVRSSRTFQLTDEATSLRVRVDPGSSTGWGWGLATTIVTGAVLLPASIALLAGQGSCDTSADPDCQQVRTQTGILCLTMTVGAGFAGLYLLLSNKTDITLTAQSPPNARRQSLWGFELSPEGVLF
jgi:hypothetical protein